MSENQITGELPSEVGNLVALKSANLKVNNITGPIPTYFGMLSSLEELELRFNGLSGTIPTQLANMKQMKKVLLDWNYLTGVVPKEICTVVDEDTVEFRIDCGIACLCCGTCTNPDLSAACVILPRSCQNRRMLERLPKKA
mmetsp:Transcript_20244/g.30809  ORF Transcript_20244/g.30809 Transcript_20244/m.30809 type:complete len:141 (+) Transcript_20244:1753-2175(+)